MCAILLLKVLFGKLKLHLLSPRGTLRRTGPRRPPSTSEAVVRRERRPFLSEAVACLHHAWAGSPAAGAPVTDRPAAHATEPFGLIVAPPGYDPERRKQTVVSRNNQLARYSTKKTWWDFALKTNLLTIQSQPLCFTPPQETGNGKGHQSAPVPTVILENCSSPSRGRETFRKAGSRESLLEQSDGHGVRSESGRSPGSSGAGLSDRGSRPSGDSGCGHPTLYLLCSSSAGHCRPPSSLPHAYCLQHAPVRSSWPWQSPSAGCPPLAFRWPGW